MTKFCLSDQIVGEEVHYLTAYNTKINGTPLVSLECVVLAT